MDKIIERMPDVEHWPEWAQDALNEGRLFRGCMEHIADLERKLAEARKAINMCHWAMRQPIDDWKGECESRAFAAIAALAGEEDDDS